MTTLLGIKANEGEPGIILAADTRYQISDKGELVREKTETKLRVRGYQWAIADAGFDDKFSQKFLSYLKSTKQEFDNFLEFFKDRKKDGIPGCFDLYGLARSIHRQYEDIRKDRRKPEGIIKLLLDYAEGREEPKDELERELTKIMKVIINMEKDPVLQALKTHDFVELELLNKHHLDNEDNEYSETVELLIATSRSQYAPGQEQLGLYRATPLGRIVPSDPTANLEYLCLGSGSEAVNAYFDKEHFNSDPEIKEILEKLHIEKISYDKITIPVAKCLVVGAMAIANREDPATGPYFDVVQVTEDGIEEYGRKLQQKIADATKEAILHDFIKIEKDETLKSE